MLKSSNYVDKIFANKKNNIGFKINHSMYFTHSNNFLLKFLSKVLIISKNYIVCIKN